MNLDNVKNVYLLIMNCKEDGYWDTSGYCHWSTPAFYSECKFELDDEESLIKSIASFISEYPKGDHEIYIVKDFDWYDNEEQKDYLNNINQKASELAKQITKEKEQKEKLKRLKEREKAHNEQVERDLKKLQELKEEYEQ